jgi:hypothetical protein
MPWVNYDDSYWVQPALVRLSGDAYKVWSRAFGHCAHQMTDGLISAEMMREILAAHGPTKRKKILAELLRNDDPPFTPLLEVVEGRGYFVPHVVLWNRSREEIEQMRADARVRKDEWRSRQSANSPPGRAEFASELDAEPSVETPRPSRPARQHRGPGQVGAVTGPRAPAPTERVPTATPERVPNNAHSTPLQDPRSPTGVCDLDPHASPGEHAHTTGTTEHGEHGEAGRPEGSAHGHGPLPGDAPSIGSALPDDDAPVNSAPPGHGRAAHVEPVREAPPDPVLAGANDTTPTGPPEDDASRDPNAEALVAQLRVMPEPMRHLATPEHASRFAGALMNGLTLDEIRSAISAAALKLGRHRGAHPSRPETIDGLADHVGAFIANQRRITARVAPQPRHAVDPVAVERVLRRWSELYETTTGVAYTATDEDRTHTADLLEVVHQAAVQEGVRTGRDQPGLEERIVDHWIRAYLDDEGPGGYLVKARHALRYVKRQVGTYGLPTAPRLAKCPVQEPEEERPPPAVGIAGTRQVLEQLRAVGTGWDGDGPPPVRRHAPGSEAG